MSDDIKDDPLSPYLAEIIAQPEAKGIILSGGFGMRLKQHHLKEQRSVSDELQITLIDELPEARATQDLDLFLNVNIWMEKDKAIALGTTLKERLGYETAAHSWQYRKALTGSENRHVKLDLMARRPTGPDKDVKVKGTPRQVGREMKTGISGRETPEAFAIDDSPILLLFPYGENRHSVLVPHPYAWLNMKVRAAYDWLLESQGFLDAKPTQEGDSARLKHVYDVYVLTAMLTQEEQSQSVALAKKYHDHEEASKTREQAAELYGSADAVGIQAVKSYARSSRVDLRIDYDLFWNEGLKIALGMQNDKSATS